jgi:hypothetical protein
MNLALAALQTQQVLTQTPCYASLPGLCSDPPKHTMLVIPAPQIDLAIQPEEPPVLPTLAFVLVTGFTGTNGSVATIVIPGLADENECHKLALKINAPKHGCFEYRMSARHIDMADAIQDAQQDGIIR